MRALVLCGILCGMAAAAEKPWMGFAAYPDARLLCDQHVSGTGMHILWRSYATVDALDRVIAFYERDTGRKTRPGAGGAPGLELDADRKLAIYPAARSEEFPSCAVKPAAGERTVILVSTAIRAH